MKRTQLLLCALGLAGLTAIPTQAAPVETQGFLKYEVWFPPLRDSTATGTAVSILTADPNYPATPDMTSYVSAFDSRKVFPDDSHMQYGARITGWITPSVTGDYDFFIRSDDASELWISTDATEANLALVAQETGCCNPFLEPGAGQTTATPLHLVAGQKYYVQALHKEGAGGDYVQVAWRLSTDTTPAASLTPIVGMMLSSTADPAGASVTITQQPQAVSTPENTAVTFTIAATGVTPYKQYTGTATDSNGTATQGGTPPLGITNNLPVFYQWFTNGVPVAGANGTNYTIPWPKKAVDGNKMVKCYVAVPGVPTYSSEVKLTVTDDLTPPTVVKATSDMTFTNLLVTFSEPVSDTALTASNYSIDQGVTVSSVSRVDLLTVQLTTSKLAESTTYTLTITGVQDTATPANTIAANTQVQFRTFEFVSGTILHKKYNGISDGVGQQSSPGGLLNDSRYPNNPDRGDIEPMWEYPPGGAGRVAADPARNYFDTLEGYFIPPKTGNYVFFICGADRFWLYLSTDDNPANMHLIAAGLGGWTNPRGWNLAQGGFDMTQLRSDSYANSAWPIPNTITLTAGKRYYLLEIHHDPSWSGADDFSATYKLDTDPDPADGDAPKLTGSVVGYYLDPNGASITFTQQPQNASVLQGRSASFSAAATGTSAYGTNMIYQWQAQPSGSSTWTNITGATATTYTTPLLAMSDNGTKYQLIAMVPALTATSRVATVTVTADTLPPVVTVGAMPDSTAGTVDVGVGFDKKVDNISAGLASNYSISPGTITSFTWFTNSQSALLKVTGLSGSGTVTVKNVADLYGNTLTSTSVSFTVSSTLKWGVVGANELGGWNAVVPVAANGFDVDSDGIAEWGSYDEATFVYEQVTGDFDKKVRVEYQDNSTTWSRAGLIVRDVLNFGVDRAAQTGSGATAPPYDGRAGRYQKCHVNPVGLTLGGMGNAVWEGNRRLDTGGQCTSALTGVNAMPKYPNAWCRIQRVGQKFTIYRSDDGVNWVNLGSTTWGRDDQTTTPMPATLYVGPEFSPENGNIADVTLRGTFLAKFRDYGDVVIVFDPQLKVSIDASGKVTITWASGALVASPTVKGTYTPVTGATSPYVVTPASWTTMFYQVKQ